MAAFSGALLVGIIPFSGNGPHGRFAGQRFSCAAYANLIYLPGCYLSGMFFPLPASMYWQTPIWPQLLMSLSSAMHPGGHHEEPA
jgi:ABC-2 type transport system permease protein